MKHKIVVFCLLAIMLVTITLSFKNTTHKVDLAASKRLSDSAEKLIRTGQLEKAKLIVIRAVNLNPENSAAYSDWAVINHKERLPQDSILHYYEIALNVEPRNCIPYLNMANYYLEEGQYDDVVHSIERLFAAHAFPNKEMFTQCSGMYEMLARAELELGKYDNAVADFKKALEYMPDNAYTHGRIANAYMRLEDYENAIRESSIAIQINPNLDFTYNCRGICYHNSGSYKQALEDYNMAISLDSNEPSHYYNRGLVYRDLKMTVEALSDFRKAYSLGDTGSKKYITELEK